MAFNSSVASLKSSYFLSAVRAYQYLLFHASPSILCSTACIQDVYKRQQDQGTGIPDYALTKIFDKFYSLPRPQNAPNGGQKSTGLGLNFVQEVIKLHLGEIHIENNSASQGVTVSILLPLNI